MAWQEGNHILKEGFLANTNQKLSEIEGNISSRDAQVAFAQFCFSNPAFATNLLMGIDLWPFQDIMLRAMFAKDYFLGICGRGIGKTCSYLTTYVNEKERGIISLKNLLPDLEFKESEYVKEISEIELWNGDSYQKTNRVLVQGGKECSIVKTRMGYELEGSINHKVKILDKSIGDVVWKRYHEIDAENDYVCISRGESPNPEEIPFQGRLNEACLIGYLLGDGSIGPNAQYNYFITNIDEELINFVLTNFPDSCKRQKSSKSLAVDIFIGSDRTKYLRKKYNIKPSLSYEKEIPQGIMENKYLLKKCLSAMYDCDGGFEQKGSVISYCTVSEVLAKQIHLSLLNFGIVSRLRLKKTNSPFGKAYIIQMHGEEAIKFYDRIGFGLSRKQAGRAHLETKKSNSNIDIIPGAMQLVWEINKESQVIKTRTADEKFRVKMTNRKDVSRNFVRDYLIRLKQLNYSSDKVLKLQGLYDCGFFFDKIESIEHTTADCIDFCDIPDGSSYWSNGFISHNSTLAGIFVPLYAIFNPGVTIGITSASFRQARSVFQKIEDISQGPKGKYFKQCLKGTPKHNSDAWEMNIGESKVVCLPLGCVTGDTRLVFTNGIAKIEEIFSGEEKEGFSNNDDSIGVFNKFNWAKSQKRYFGGIKPTIITKTRSNYSVESSFSHKFLDENFQWKEAQDFKIGDLIAIDIQEKWPTNPQYKNNIDDSYVLGLMIGDGSYVNPSFLHYTDTEGELIGYIKSITGWDWRHYKNDEQHYYHLGKENAKRWRDFWGLGLNYGRDKYIPEKIFKGDKESAIACLQGLFDNNGHASFSKKDGHTSILLGFTSESPKLTNDIQAILNCLGIHSYWKQRTDRNVCDLLITGEDAKKFVKTVGFRLKRKQKLAEKILTLRKRSVSFNGVKNRPLIVNFIARSNSLGIRSGRLNPRLGLARTKRKSVLNSIILEEIYNFYNHPDNEFAADVFDLVQNCKKFRLEPIVSLTESENLVYDLYVDDGNCYTANGFVSHNSGERIRGYRFNLLVIDELLLLSEKIINEVLLPFMAIQINPRERQKIREAEAELVKQGLMKPEDVTRFSNNKLIGLTSASYQFEYLYSMFEDYKRLIFSDEAEHVSHGIMQLSCEMAPPGLYDESNVENARKTYSRAQFDREYMAQFTGDSSGFYSAKKLYEISLIKGQSPSIKIKGESGKTYLLAMDANYDSSETSDDFAIDIFEIDADSEQGFLVHAYAVASCSLQERMDYIRYIFDNFEIVYVIVDKAGGNKFIKDINDLNVLPFSLGFFGAEFETFDEKELQTARASYSNGLKIKNIVHSQYFSAQWIRMANESLSGAIDGHRIWFAAPLDPEGVNFDGIDINTIKFTDKESYGNRREDIAMKKIDFVDNQSFVITKTKNQCALIEASTTSTGVQRFDLPASLQKQTGPDKARKDSYSALVLGNWGLNCYFSLLKTPEKKRNKFIARFIA